MATNLDQKETSTEASADSSSHAQQDTTGVYEKRILLTGGAGFIGSNVALHLAEKYPEYQVIVLDMLTYCGNLHNIYEGLVGRDNLRFVRGDICNKELVLHVFEQFDVDTVIHFAAETHVDHSFNGTTDFIRTNIFGTVTLLDCARLHWGDNTQGKLFVHVSTDEVYGESLTDEPFSEEDLTEASGGRKVYNPSNPYAASKAAAEMMALSYLRSFQFPLIVTRSNNVFGPRQFPEKLVPKFICMLRHGRKITLHGSGLNRRTYVFTEDICRAFDVIIHKGLVGHVYNIGSDQEFTNLAVTRTLLRTFFGASTEREVDALFEKHVVFVRNRKFNDARYFISYDKITRLGWQPEVSFEDGLRKTIAWYRRNADSFWKDLSTVLVAHPSSKPRTNEFYTDNRQLVRAYVSHRQKQDARKQVKEHQQRNEDPLFRVIKEQL